MNQRGPQFAQFRRGALDGWRRRLQAVDRKLLAAVPALGRYYWETVITFER